MMPSQTPEAKRIQSRRNAMTSLKEAMEEATLPKKALGAPAEVADPEFPKPDRTRLAPNPHYTKKGMAKDITAWGRHIDSQSPEEISAKAKEKQIKQSYAQNDPDPGITVREKKSQTKDAYAQRAKELEAQARAVATPVQGFNAHKRALHNDKIDNAMATQGEIGSYERAVNQPVPTASRVTTTPRRALTDVGQWVKDQKAKKFTQYSAGAVPAEPVSTAMRDLGAWKRQKDNERLTRARGPLRGAVPAPEQQGGLRGMIAKLKDMSSRGLSGIRGMFGAKHESMQNFKNLMTLLETRDLTPEELGASDSDPSLELNPHADEYKHTLGKTLQNIPPELNFREVDTISKLAKNIAGPSSPKASSSASLPAVVTAAPKKAKPSFLSRIFGGKGKRDCVESIKVINDIFQGIVEVRRLPDVCSMCGKRSFADPCPRCSSKRERQDAGLAAQMGAAPTLSPSGPIGGGVSRSRLLGNILSTFSGKPSEPEAVKPVTSSAPTKPLAQNPFSAKAIEAFRKKNDEKFMQHLKNSGRAHLLNAEDESPPSRHASVGRVHKAPPGVPTNPGRRGTLPEGLVVRVGVGKYKYVAEEAMHPDPEINKAAADLAIKINNSKLTGVMDKVSKMLKGLHPEAFKTEPSSEQEQPGSQEQAQHPTQPQEPEEQVLEPGQKLHADDAAQKLRGYKPAEGKLESLGNGRFRFVRA